MLYEESMDWLYSKDIFHINLGLERIYGLLEKIGNPENSFKSIHIAGTNGKGSVTAYLSSILTQSGYKVGVYTSPHLVDFRERIRIGNQIISKSDFVRLIEILKPNVTDQTFFEITTAIAFLYFKEQNIDFGVIEVGLGGRLDATNVITPIASVITNISLEHISHLGDTIEKIAFEKAGIIKSKVPVVTCAQDLALDVIKQISEKNNSEIHQLVGNKPFIYELGLVGGFQINNAKLALRVIKILQKQGVKIPKETIVKGLKHAYWPGRMQFIKEKLMFDCAHNPKAIDVLVSELKTLGFDDIILIIGIMKDKDIPSMIGCLETIAKDIIITKPKINRAANPSYISKFINKQYTIIEDVSDAISYAKQLSEDRLIVLTGSIFTVGEGFSALGIKPFTSKIS